MVTCKPETDYRIEAVVSCTLEAPMEDGSAGLRIVVREWQGDGKREGSSSWWRSRGILRSTEPTVVRLFLRTPKGMRRMHLSIGVEGAAGTASIREVRCVELLQPDLVSHPMAIPPPAHAMPAPRVARSACVCSVTAADRVLTEFLRASLGSRRVRTVDPREFDPSSLSADALFLPDKALPPALGTLSRLMRVAEERIVIVSLPALASVSNGALSLRRVEQPDDPIHAKVVYADHATRGFALHDVFPYAWTEKQPGSFVQRQFRKNRTLAPFCKRHGLVTLLTSMCDQDATSDRPIAFFRATKGGGLYVLDIEPVEDRGSTRGEPCLAGHLLLAILGHVQPGLGQFTVPSPKTEALREMMRDTQTRFAPFVVCDSGLPAEELTDQWITIGAQEESLGLPLRPRPAIVVRTGLAPGDAEAVYGAYYWFKQLVRMPPHTCPYAETLVSRFRLMWQPCAGPWAWADGADRNAPREDSPPGLPEEVDMGEAAALIDLVSRPRHRVRVVVSADRGGVHRRMEQWLPRLLESFPPANVFVPHVPAGASFADRDALQWGWLRWPVRVEVEEHGEEEGIRQRFRAGGATLIRIEVPGSPADFVGHSIHRTGLAATVLEQVIGLVYGLIAVNRTGQTVQFDGVPPVQPGQAVVLDDQAPLLRQEASWAG
ncbi:MAG: hypothetical protein D6788_12110 [Planctomycetota bacterium]|nr:MAG: hypothetical protein D6788_12110 [Planctomycetota bacterium]